MEVRFNILHDLWNSKSVSESAATGKLINTVIRKKKERKALFSKFKIARLERKNNVLLILHKM
jgi:hypothetical protein